jgi:hypothetical protein
MFVDEAMVASAIRRERLRHSTGRGDLIFMVLEWIVGES